MSDARATCVLLVMKSAGNLRVTEQVLAASGLPSRGAASEAELDALLASEFTPDLALIDMSGFGPSGWRMCMSLQERKLPFIVLSRPCDLEMSSQSLQFGALSVLQKPVAKTALLQLIGSFAR